MLQPIKFNRLISFFSPPTQVHSVTGISPTIHQITQHNNKSNPFRSISRSELWRSRKSRYPRKQDEPKSKINLTTWKLQLNIFSSSQSFIPFSNMTRVLIFMCLQVNDMQLSKNCRNIKNKIRIIKKRAFFAFQNTFTPHFRCRRLWLVNALRRWKEWPGMSWNSMVKWHKSD